MNHLLKRLFTLTLAGFCGVALAGEFSVSPVRLDFTGIARSQLLAITNSGATTARFLVRPAGWSMDEAGGVELTDDDSLIVFPASFTLAPRATQNVRVGTEQRAGDTEKTWRVVLEELPDANAAGSGGATISVLSVISVPVFLPPLVPRKAITLAWTGTDSRAMTLTLGNQGNAHEVIAAVSVTARRQDEVVQQTQAEGWYLLPGKRRAHVLAGDKPWCSLGATRFELRATDRAGQVLASQSLDASEACR